ncbi:MAG: hypothetical protein JWM14_2129 [Chitinophagaceae bacterium]|nr:hypothetical protein [Chitinophagaceae bacterium]
MQNSFLKNSFLFLGTFFFLASLSAQAQDDLLALADTVPVKSTRSLPAFKTTRIVNGHSVETVKAHHLDFRVTHHFGDIGGSAGGVHTMYGLDNAADIRIAFEYGVTERLTIGAGRSKISEMVDAYLKYRLLYQTEDNKVPVSLTLFANAAITPQQATDNSPYNNVANRLSYVYQVLIARRFNSRLSWQVMPAFFHRNFVFDPLDENDLFVLGTGMRLKLTKRFALLADYYFIFSGYRMERQDLYFPPLGLGVEIETGGHVFHLTFTNNPAIVENSYFANSTDSWSKGQIKFGFNISRTFGIGKKGRKS